MPLPPLSLLDLFPAYPVAERSVSYMQLVGGAPTGADVVAHGAVKPSANFVYDALSAEVQTVAVWTKAKRQDLDDFEGLAASLQVLLSYDVRRKVESLLIAAIRGAGIGAPDFTGWTDVTNVRDQAIVAAAEQAVFGHAVNFAAYSPLDLAALSVKKTTTGEYLQTPPGPREVSTSALDRTEVLVGDANIGAKVAVRSGLSVAIGQEADDLTRNLVTILVECRVLPVVLVPNAFSLVT